MIKRSSKLVFFAVIVLGCVLTTRAMARDLTPTDRVVAHTDSATVAIIGVCCAWSPNNVTIQVGDSVMWSANFSFHPLRQVDGPTSDTPVPGGFAEMGPASSYTYQFNSAGTFYYQCAFHGLAASGGTIARQDCGASRGKHTHGEADFKPNIHQDTHCHRVADKNSNIQINTDSHRRVVSLLPTRLPATGAEVKSGRSFIAVDWIRDLRPVSSFDRQTA